MLRTTSARTRRGGFTMVELIVVICVIAVLAAVIVPAVVGRVRDGQTTALAQTMTSLSQGISSYRVDVRRYPTRLAQLTTAPGATTRDPCGRLVPTAFRDLWRGPYVPTQITTAGLRVSDALVQDTMQLDPTPFTTTAVGYLLIETADVDRKSAEALDRSFDGDDDLAAGVVRWTEVAGDRGTLLFGVRVRGC